MKSLRYGVWTNPILGGIAAWLFLGIVGPAANAQNITVATTVAIQRLLQVAAPPAVSMPVWTLRVDSPRAAYTRNLAVWTGATNGLTGKAVWNSFTGRYGTTAVSPRHVIYADHVRSTYPVGTIVRFVTQTNVVVERFVVSSRRIGATDIDVSTLDSILPATIHWFKVMPEHWFLKCYRQAAGTRGGLPCIVLDANTGSVAVKDFAGFFPVGFATATPVDPLRRAFTKELYSGDSGSPMFVLIDGNLVLDGIYGTAGGGVEVSSNLLPLNVAMRADGYCMTVADLGTHNAP